MGISAKNGCQELLNRTLSYVGKPMQELSVAEYGNQNARTYTEEGEKIFSSHRHYFRWFGARYVSFDTNGRNGAKPIDLGHCIPHDVRRQWIGTFDIVTDFGTTEHIKRMQYWAFRNAHDLCAVGGYMIHALPRVDSCGRHGHWKYSTDWFSWLAERQQYKVEELYERKLGEHRNTETIYVFAILKKSEQRFMPAREWRDPVQQGLPLTETKVWRK